MNKNIKKIVVAALACVALCGTTLAAPRGGHGRGPARHPAPVHRVVHHHPAPVHHVVHHHEGEALGVGLVTGLIGGLIGGLLAN